MRAFTYRETEYRSLAECCKSLKISYQKVRRFCRHYVRANRNPALAVSWCLGEAKLSPFEPKSFKYEQDLERGQDRQERFLERKRQELMENF